MDQETACSASGLRRDSVDSLESGEGEGRGPIDALFGVHGLYASASGASTFIHVRSGLKTVIFATSASVSSPRSFW